MKKKMSPQQLRDVLRHISNADPLEMEILLSVIEAKSNSATPIIDDKDLEEAIDKTVDILEERNNALSQPTPDWIEVLSVSETRTGDRGGPSLSEFIFPAQPPRKGH
ncbi:hypothetical protein B0I32_14720 [Nonomuraea fuscirosea]|uniref:Uncharacterized protein n=1 Tax=Nonomuraea fuscirosea TaxID=1291556 RepID=A0A2T0LQW5_9ACTN|nr:hypothetical protein [Nonomuraea fuscirosea]PRX45733.1 hypothetical protein B0I32_14720 [Nonomuraea fuscirosea]